MMKKQIFSRKKKIEKNKKEKISDDEVTDQEIEHKEDDFICSICLNFIAKSMTTICGHSYCQICLFEYLLFFVDCPKCTRKIKNEKDYGQSLSLDVIVQKLVESSQDEKVIKDYQQRMIKNKQWNQQRVVKEFKIGQELDVQTKQYVWCKAKIQRIILKSEKQKYITVTFMNLPNFYNEEISEKSQRLANCGFLTNREDIPKLEIQNNTIRILLDGKEIDYDFYGFKKSKDDEFKKLVLSDSSYMSNQIIQIIMGNCGNKEEQNYQNFDLFLKEQKFNDSFDMVKTKLLLSKNGLNKHRTDKEIMSKFEIVKTLGEGLFSKVYLVLFRKKFYALKVIKKKKFQSLKQIQRIVFEKEVMRNLNQRNCLKIIDCKQSVKHFYYLLEYCEKGNLLRMMTIKMQLNENEIRIIAGQILSGLFHIHGQGLIYGDVKLENCLLNKNGVVKICDFNLSGTRQTLVNQISGTAVYLAPEVIIKKKKDKSSDFWSFGVLLYFLIECKYPFLGFSREEVYKNILNKEVPPIKREISKSLKDFIKMLLNKNPDLRITEEQIKEHKFFENYDWNNSLNEDFLTDIENMEREQFQKKKTKFYKIESQSFTYELKNFTMVKTRSYLDVSQVEDNN